MSVAQPPLNWIPSPSYTPGRQGTPVRHITFHHAVGSAESAVARFQNVAQQVSSHFIVSPTQIYCMVDTDDTAYTNGVWASNLESVTIEHAGDWRNGFRDDNVIARSAILVAWLRTLYPDATFNRHRDVYPTQCCGDLPVEEIWAKAGQIINPPAPAQPEWLVNRTPLAIKKYVQHDNTQLWSLTNTNNVADSRVFKTNDAIDIGSQTTVGTQKYFITAYSTSKNVAAGYKAEDLADIPYTPPVVVTPPKPPVVIPPVEPEYPNWFVQFWQKLIAAILSILNKKG